MPVVPVYKPSGWTPLQAIDALRTSRAELRDAPMTYAGRLDPMAEGVLIVLSGEDRHRRDEFLKLDKEYRATILFGYSSDSYDALGLVEEGTAFDRERARTVLEKLVGVHHIPFPPYSSFKVQGKPLHWWAQQGRLHEIEAPIKRMEVYTVTDVSVEQRSSQTVLNDITERIRLVRGDFRQQMIVDRWRSTLVDTQPLTIATVTLRVSSGTYVRSLVHDLGQKLGCGALLFSLQRTKVGEYKTADAFRF